MICFLDFRMVPMVGWMTLLRLYRSYLKVFPVVDISSGFYSGCLAWVSAAVVVFVLGF